MGECFITRRGRSLNKVNLDTTKFVLIINESSSGSMSLYTSTSFSSSYKLSKIHIAFNYANSSGYSITGLPVNTDIILYANTPYSFTISSVVTNNPSMFGTYTFTFTYVTTEATSSLKIVATRLGDPCYQNCTSVRFGAAYIRESIAYDAF